MVRVEGFSGEGLGFRVWGERARGSDIRQRAQNTQTAKLESHPKSL